MHLLFIAILATTAPRIWACLRQLRFLRAAHGEGRARDYGAAIARLRIAHALAYSLCAMALLFALSRRPPAAGFGGAIVVLTGFACVQYAADLAIGALRIFSIDASFGFNRLGSAAFVREAASALAQRLLLAVPLAAVALVLVRLTGVLAWLPFGLLVGFGAEFVRSYRARVQRPREELRVPLAPSALRDRLQTLSSRCGFAGAELVVVHGSARSLHANARAEQAGGRVRVVLFDTLLQALPSAEVEATVAHELGHLAAGHLRLRFMLVFTIWLAVLASASALVNAVFPPSGTEGWPYLAAILVLAPALRAALQPLLLSATREWEFAADAYAIRHVPAAELREALRRLADVNATPPRSDPWYAAFHEAHPSLTERLARLE